MVLAALSWAVFAVLSTLVMRPFVRLSASSPEAVQRRLSRSTPILQLARPRNASPAARMIDFPFSFSAISVWFFMVSSS